MDTAKEPKKRGAVSVEEPLIEIRDLLMRRSGRDVLQVDALNLRRGEILAVVGPNGGGKSTLLLALAHLLRPARGVIRFEGKPLEDWNALEYRRRISFVFQSPLLLDMTVEQNVELGLRFRGIPKEERRARVHPWLKALGIESLAQRRAAQLSGGEAQRVSLARAFVLDPELLLLDEPFAALDPPTRARLLEDMSQILKADHKTAVFVTHNLDEAAKLSHRVAVVAEGRFQQAGTAHEIKTHPAGKAVQVFLKELSQ